MAAEAEPGKPELGGFAKLATARRAPSRVSALVPQLSRRQGERAMAGGCSSSRRWLAERENSFRNAQGRRDDSSLNDQCVVEKKRVTLRGANVTPTWWFLKPKILEGCGFKRARRLLNSDDNHHPSGEGTMIASTLSDSPWTIALMVIGLLAVIVYLYFHIRSGRH